MRPTCANCEHWTRSQKNCGKCSQYMEMLFNFKESKYEEVKLRTRPYHSCGRFTLKQS